LRAFTHAD